MHKIVAVAVVVLVCFMGIIISRYKLTIDEQSSKISDLEKRNKVLSSAYQSKVKQLQDLQK